MTLDSRLPLTLAALALLAWWPPAAAQTPGQKPGGPSFRTGVEVVSLNVTVTDAANRYVTDLTQEDFAVYEDGSKQELVLFNRTNLPVALLFLLDTSSSMEDKMSTAQEAAIGFARRLRTQDLAEVVDFDSRVDVLQSFTNDISLLERAIRRAVAGGSTSLYNAIYISLKELKKAQITQSDEVRRQAIVLLSDGEDTSSLVTFDEVLDLARRSETAIYAIGLITPEVNPSRGFREATYALKQLTADTGGRVFFPSDVKTLASVYAQIFDDLASQYTVGYTSKNQRRDGAWRRVVVRINRPNTVARTKQGYYAPSAR